MMYRAKCTWILNDLRTIYHGKKLNVVRDATDSYVEVSSEFEADLIEAANRCAKQQQHNLTRLYDIVRPLPAETDYGYLIVDGAGWVSNNIRTCKEDALESAQTYAKDEDWQGAGFVKVVKIDLNRMRVDDIEKYVARPGE